MNERFIVDAVHQALHGKNEKKTNLHSKIKQKAWVFFENLIVSVSDVKM